MADLQYSQRNEDGLYHCFDHTGQVCKSKTFQNVYRFTIHCRIAHNTIIKATIRDTVDCVKNANDTYICSEQFPNNCCTRVFELFDKVPSSNDVNMSGCFSCSGSAS